MKINAIAILVVSALLCGCEIRNRNAPETQLINEKNANYPEFVANTPKGKLYRIWIDMGSVSHSDRVYFIENDTNLTVNSTIFNKKISRTETSFIINGVEYIRK